MRLVMVTFEPDYTQFLIEADNREKAIDYAIKANKEYDRYDEDLLEDIENRSNYFVGDVEFEDLKYIIQRNDWLICKRLEEPVIVFTS